MDTPRITLDGGWKRLAGFPLQTLDLIRLDLTRENPEYVEAFRASRSTKGIPTEVYLYQDDGDDLLVPRFFNTDHLPAPYSYDERLAHAPVSMPPSRFVPRASEQEQAVAALVNQLQNSRGGLLLAGTGKGKTVMGVEIALRLGHRTLVLVHKDFLAEQFEATWAMLTGLPKESVGRVQQDVCRIGEHVTVALVQTLLSRRFDESFYSQFGLIIGDEVHRHGAAEWGRTISLFRAEHRLGLTASLKRRDGMHEAVLLHFGPVGFTIEGTDHDPIIYQMKRPTFFKPHTYTSWKCESCGSRLTLENSELRCRCKAVAPGVNNAVLLNLLVADKERATWLSQQTRKALDAGRRVLFISDRIDQLDAMLDAYPEQAGRFYGTATSKKAQAEFAAALSKPLLLTTYGKAGEGLDVPALDTLVFGTPRANVQQPCGRILRLHDGKQRPLIVDPFDYQIPILRAYAYARRRFYTSQGWTCIEK